MSYRIVCWDDVFLSAFDARGRPQWDPRDDAAEYPDRLRAHVACREARIGEGLSRGTVHVRVVKTVPPSSEKQEKTK